MLLKQLVPYLVEVLLLYNKGVGCRMSKEGLSEETSPNYGFPSDDFSNRSETAVLERTVQPGVLSQTASMHSADEIYGFLCKSGASFISITWIPWSRQIDILAPASQVMRWS